MAFPAIFAAEGTLSPHWQEYLRVASISIAIYECARPPFPVIFRSTEPIEDSSSPFRLSIDSTHHKHDGRGRVWPAYSSCSFGTSLRWLTADHWPDAGRLLSYSSVLIITLTNVGQFASFSEAACNRYYIVTPVFKGAACAPARPLRAHSLNCLHLPPAVSRPDLRLPGHPLRENICHFQAVSNHCLRSRVPVPCLHRWRGRLINLRSRTKQQDRSLHLR